MRVLLQVAYFILLARALGPGDYGAFAGVLALVLILAPFASWGSGNILVKYASRDAKCFPEYWGAAVATTLLSGGGLTLVAVALATMVFGWEKGLGLALPIALGDLMGTRLADTASQAFQAVQRMSGTSAIWAGTTLLRLLGVAFLIVSPLGKDAFTWAWVYAVTGLLSGALSVLSVRGCMGWGPLSLRPMQREWREGLYFSVSLSSQGAYNDLDKALLARLISDTTAGVYTAAYRVIDAAFLPVRSLLYAAYPRFFQEGARGLMASKALAKRFLPWSLSLAVTVALAVVVFSPLLKFLLGEEYGDIALVAVWLLPVLMFRSLHYFAADALTGAGLQGMRSAFQVGVAALNLGLNLLLIPPFGWKGAAMASWISDGALVLGLWGYLFKRSRTTATEGG